MNILQVGKHMVVNPAVCHGKLTFKGTRLPVETVLTVLVKEQRSIDYVLKSWPHLKTEAVAEALRLAAAAWPEFLDDKMAEKIEKLAASLNSSGDKRTPKVYEPVRSGRTA